MQQRDPATATFDSNLDSSGHTASRQSSSLNPLQPSKHDVAYLDGKREVNRTLHDKSPNRTRRLRLLLIVLVLLIVAAGIALGVYFGTRGSKKSSDSNPSASPSVSSPTPSNSKILYGGDGTIVTTEDGTKFVYNNSFGGYFSQDPDNPFNNDARAQSWSPPLNQSWQFGKDQILGCVDSFFFRLSFAVDRFDISCSVNLGGWLVLEPFITPALYQKYPNAIDEWTLHTLMAADTAGGGINQIEEHYKTFIVRLLSFAHAVAIANTRGMPDRGRLRSDRWRRTQLDTSTYPVLGYRYLAGGTFSSQGLLEVCAQGIRLGTEVRHPHYA
jgi:hypothetical protein